MTVAEDILLALASEPGAPSERAEFLAWCAQPKPDGPAGISRFLFALFRSRADLQQTFLGIYLDPAKRVEFLTWAHHFAAPETGAPAQLVPAATEIEELAREHREWVSRRAKPSRGVGVLGYSRSVLGLGAAARRLASVLALAGEPIHIYAYEHTNSPWLPGVDPRSSRTDGTTRPDVLVSVLAPHELPLVPQIVGEDALVGVIRVALCFWETETLPPELSAAFDGISELWVTSDFTAAALRPAVADGVEVVVIPLGTDSGSATKPDRATWSARLGCTPATIVVGQVFDYSSGLARKNPEGLIRAWMTAFPVAAPTERMLVLKTVGAEARIKEADAFAHWVASLSRSDITFVSGSLSAPEMDGLLQRFDAVASLHRAEGYGLVLLDAMHRGVPVIATGYSGNLAFMDHENSWLVDARPVVLTETDGPYPPGSRWAEPDTEHAAHLLRVVVAGLSGTDPGAAVEVERKCRHARRATETLVDGSAAAAVLAVRLAALRRRYGSG